MAKKTKCPDAEAGEKWLVAYGDMMTLLFALFVVLYAIQNQDMEKLKAAAKSIQKAFGMATEENPDATGFPSGNSRREESIFNKVKGNTTRESTATRNRRERAAIISADAATIERVLRDEFKGTKEADAITGDSENRVVYFNRDPDGIRISLLARGFFLPNRVELDPSANRILDGVASAVKGAGRMVRIEGHTDGNPTKINLSIMKAEATNWELSVLRAATVVRYMIDRHEFPKDGIYAAGYGDTRPIAPNDTMEHRAVNRRIDIKILYESPTEYVEPDKLPPNAEVVPAKEAEEPETPKEPAKPEHANPLPAH